MNGRSSGCQDEGHLPSILSPSAEADLGQGALSAWSGDLTGTGTTRQEQEQQQPQIPATAGRHSTHHPQPEKRSGPLSLGMTVSFLNEVFEVGE